MKVIKMHGCGNDFCVIPYQELTDYSELAKKICNRKIGVGADGLIVVKQDPLEMIFYNCDGSRAPMCGNGIRCFSKYVYDNKLAKRNKFDVVTLAGVMNIEVIPGDIFMCKVNMGKPNFNNSMIYAADPLDFFGRVIKVKDINVTVFSFFMGTVHTVIFVDSFNDDVLNYADDICNHPLFEKKTNVNFVIIDNKKEMYVKTYERGVGWTLACGTGCCASVVAANKLKKVFSKCRVWLELGFLDIEIVKNNVYMTGPAEEVFSCDFNVEVK